MKTILFMPLDGVGHVNACIGLAECLRDRGHKIIFVVSRSWSGKLVAHGFIEEILVDKNESEGKPLKPGENMANRVLKLGLLSNLSSIEKMKVLLKNMSDNSTMNRMIANEPQLKLIIEKHNPDIFILDNTIGSPSILYSGKPWVLSISTSPLFFYDDERVPPGCSGYPSNGDKNEWIEFRKISKQLLKSVDYNEWLIRNGYPANPENRRIPFSPYLNLYQYPEELDYTDIRPMPENWLRIDSFMRKGEEEFELPIELLRVENNNYSGKLIYFSMGSMGGIDVKMMERLVAILSKSKHQFIVSKGLLHEKYELADNMWGKASVPQTKVLPLVDLVISHGGNNTVAETLSFGKPMIALPLFADHYDTAQRIHEKGFGIRLNPYDCSEEELLNAVDVLLYDEALKIKLDLVSKRMQNSKCLVKATEFIEKLMNSS